MKNNKKPKNKNKNLYRLIIISVVIALIVVVLMFELFREKKHFGVDILISKPTINIDIGGGDNNN